MGVLSSKYGELISPLFRYINVSRSDTEVMIPGIFPTPAPSTPAHQVNAQYKHYCASSKIINSRMGSSPSYLLVHTHSDTCCCSNTVQLAASARGPSHEDPPARTVTCLPGPQLRAATRQGITVLVMLLTLRREPRCGSLAKDFPKLKEESCKGK